MNPYQRKLMRFLAAFLVSVFAPLLCFAAEIPAEISLWPNGAPGSEGKTAKEVVVKSNSGEISVWSIHNPSLTPYLPPKEKATGTAMLVIPGAVTAISQSRMKVTMWQNG